MESGSTHLDQNGEDSSGSDNVSLLSAGVPATETDRFGFILGTGSTVGNEGPPPEVVRQRETKWLNIISQWDRIILKKTNKVKDQCRKGIPASLRARCWPLLCCATERMKQNKTLYQSLDSAPGLQSWVDVIERDIDRQFPFHEMFLSRDGHGQRGLFRVLKAYTQFRPDEGYCQGQGPVAAVLLMNMPAEEAFWCLVQISEQYLPGYYSPLLEGVLFDAGVLSGVLRRACPAAHKHLQKHGVEPLMFATDWLMCLYTRHLPFNTLLRVWDLFFCYGVRVLFQVAVVLVRRTLGRPEQREECEGQMETLEKLRGVKARILQEDDAFIEEVCSVPLSGKDLERETEKELQRWRKERPASTFDPRHRCHGYRAAWRKEREREEAQQKVEREKGNLSVPLLRSPSSLSPSLLRKKLRRESRTEMGEKEGGGGR
ncbi:TBC1 domain family member 10A, partial [Megalops cyprinoides]|uniref:TBC1 domain family member 10A n=1 Tax=Megalops cyprinoides TaxID=118141 RepID=UPI001864185A